MKVEEKPQQPERERILRVESKKSERSEENFYDRDLVLLNSRLYIQRVRRKKETGMQTKLPSRRSPWIDTKEIIQIIIIIVSVYL